MKMNSKALAAVAILICMLAASCSKSVRTNSNADKKVYNSTAVIKAIDISTNKVTIDHKDIPGFMSAMEMTFSAADKSIIEGIAVGDTVAFELERTDGKVVLTKITKTAATVSVSGSDVFAASCAECHGDKGEGAKKGIPQTSGHALAHSEEEYVKQVNNGTPHKMPAFKDKLTPEQIAAVVKYLRTEIQSGVTPEQREHKH